jgi:hypothetical protein
MSISRAGRAFVVLAAACNVPTGPNATTLFELVSVDGNPLPARWAGPPGITAVRATIALPTLRPHAVEGLAATSLTLRSSAGDETEVQADRVFVREGMSLRFNVCPRNAFCPAVLPFYSYALLYPDSLVFPGGGGDQRLVYLRR